jgi:PPOX class probable F420-dependent enzyme
VAQRQALTFQPMPGLEIPAVIEEFLKLPNGAVVGCVRPDGFPMTVVTWYDWEEGRALLNMDERRSRLRWMRLNPKVSLTVFDETWYRHVSLRGLVDEIKEDADLADIDRLARRYTGRPFSNRAAKRVSVWMRPTALHRWEL